jgi:thioredoxin reductase
MIKVYHRRCFPSYCDIDEGSARCRIASSLHRRFSNIKIGSIIKITVQNGLLECHYLCIAWPDSENALSENELALDDTISYSAACEGWNFGDGKVMLLS